MVFNKSQFLIFSDMKLMASLLLAAFSCQGAMSAEVGFEGPEKKIFPFLLISKKFWIEIQKRGLSKFTKVLSLQLLLEIKSLILGLYFQKSYRRFH